MKSWPIWLAGLATLITFIFYAAALIIINWPLADGSLQNTALFGDSFGALNALFTGGAFLLILWTIVLQQQELRLQRQEMSRMVAAQQRMIHFDLMSIAIKDNTLMQVFGKVGETAIESKQFVYINMVLMMFLTNFEQNLMSEHNIKTYINTHMRESQFFRAFWEGARKHRQLFLETGDDKAAAFYALVDHAYESAMEEIAAEAC